MSEPAPPPSLDPTPQAPSLERPPISPAEAMGFLAVGLAGVGVASLLGSNPSTVGGAIAPALVVLGWIGPAWWLSSRRGKDPLVVLALVGRPRALGVACAVSVVLLALFVLALLLRAGGPTQPIAPALHEALVLFAWQLAFVGLPEEVYFRGVLLPALTRDDARGVPVLGARLGGSVVIQALLFGGAHLLVDALQGQPPTAMRALTVFPAIWFAWLRLRTGSVVPGIVAHALSNAVLRVCGEIGLLS